MMLAASELEDFVLFRMGYDQRTCVLKAVYRLIKGRAAYSIVPWAFDREKNPIG